MPAPTLTVLLVCVTLGAWLGPEAAVAAGWTAPVPGPPTRLFALGPDPFARGQHRGVDLDAAPGEPVRSACTGRVLFAGRVTGIGTVSVRCGPWRVTYAPLERVAVRATALVGPGRRLGQIAGADAGRPPERNGWPARHAGRAVRHAGRAVRHAGRAAGHAGRAAGHAGRAAGHAGRAAGHAGLHFGVRREGRRFGYVDPLRFLGAPRRAPPPVLPASPSRAKVRARPAAHPAQPSPTLAPWPVWLGLALLMTGVAGAGTLRFPYRRQEGPPCRASSTSSSSPTTPSSP